MKRWLTHLGIGVYLLALAFGFFSHMCEVATACNPIMYFLVYDMFCGWAGYEARMHIIGEGESGKYYELAPPPWGEFHPYGFIARHHYDPNLNNGWVLARNVLEHTRHEPMVRIFVVEEEYPKRFNLPDAQYTAYYGKPKEFHSYYHTRFVLSPDGQIMNAQPTWFTYQYQAELRDNPRLAAEMYKKQPFLPTGPQVQTHGAYAPGHFYEPSTVLSVGAPLAE